MTPAATGTPGHTWDHSLTHDTCSTPTPASPVTPKHPEHQPHLCRPSTWDPTGACNVHDTLLATAIPVTPVPPVTAASPLATRGTHDTGGTHGTCDTLNTSGTHDNNGKVAEGTHCLPDVPDTGSSTLVGQPESTSLSLPGPHQKKKGVAGRIWKCLSRYLCCGLPSKRANNKVIPETANE